MGTSNNNNDNDNRGQFYSTLYQIFNHIHEPIEQYKTKYKELCAVG